MDNYRQPLSASILYKACNPREFDFSTTDQLADIGVVIGQERALDAIQFGISIVQNGYNIFALGPSGSGKLAAVKEIVGREAENRPVPDDWCYVNNFAEASKPKALRLPAGQGRSFARDMEQVIEELSAVIPAAFEGEEYRGRAEEIEEEAKEREINALSDLRRKSLQHGIALIETPTGFAFAPVDEKGEVLGPEQFQKLSDHQQEQIQEAVTDLRQQLQKLLKQFPVWRKEAKEKLKTLNREIAEFAVNHLMDDLKVRYQAIPGVVQYLNEAQREIIDHAEDFFPKQEAGIAALIGHAPRPSPFLRYKVNLLVDNVECNFAPVLFESLPSHNNLVGRVEFQAYMGALVTDFTMIKPGALHKANGGYLILDARKVLMQPFAWDSLKRILQSREIRIESLERALSVISTSSLEPEPIPLDIKIILIGDRVLYYLLNVYDPEFRELFKVSADFEEAIDRDANGNALYARLIASLARRSQLRPLDKEAVIRVVEHAARQVEDSEKLSTHLRSLDDLLKEADHWAGQGQRLIITRNDVQAAIDHQIRRADRLRERIYENIRRGTIFIDTVGAAVGQINGLSIISLGDFAFGQPSRITATTRLGSGKILDVERESELGGAIHTKGVMILSGFLAQRYAKTRPFSVAASLVFEQSYGQVEGDSASVAELSAILSSLADLPIHQSLAVTGSVNQHGKVQPIGGVNEKIEGFFDICSATGLNGKQGVIIPSANVKHLMLRQDVVKAAESGLFHVYAVDTVDQALELLMDWPAGDRDTTGAFPADSINGRVERRLREWTDIQKEFKSQEKSGENQNHG